MELPRKAPLLKWRITGVEESGQPVVRVIVAESQEEARAAAILDGMKVRSVERYR